RLCVARLELSKPLEDYLATHGRPIRYGYVPHAWPLDAYQTIFAVEPGSAEMPSAARPFTPELVTELAVHGVLIAPVTLHTRPASPGSAGTPNVDRIRALTSTPGLLHAFRPWSGRLTPVGPPVVRALETVATPNEKVADGEG